MAGQDVRFVMAVEDQGFIRKMTEAEQALYKLQGTTKTATDAFTNLWKGFVTGQFIVNGIRKAFSLVKNELASTVSEAIEAEKVDRALESALMRTGQAAGGAADHFKNYASELQKKTIYDDEAIKSSQTLMISMGLSVGIMDKATKGAIGLAHVFTMDLDGAARAVALGFQGNYRALNQLIPSVRMATTEGEKQAAMMKALGGYYQQAEAATGTYAGRVSQLQNAWRDVKEEVGKVITQSTFVLGFLKDQTAYLQSLNAKTEESAFSWSAIYRALSGGNIAGIIASTAAATGETADKTEILDAKLRALANTFVNEVRPAIPLVSKAMEDQGAYVQTLTDRYAALNDDLRMFRMLSGNINAAAPIINTFGTLGDMVGGELGKIIDSEDKAAEGLFDLADTTKKVFNKMTDYSAEFYQDLTRGFTNAFMQFALTAEGFKNFFVGLWQAIKQAFFQILADMLAKWIAMAFVRFLMRTFALATLGPIAGPAGTILPMQHGFHGIIQKPTLALIGENGPERADVGPVGSRGGGQTINATINLHTTGVSRRELEIAADDLLYVINGRLRLVGRSI